MAILNILVSIDIYPKIKSKVNIFSINLMCEIIRVKILNNQKIFGIKDIGKIYHK